MIGRMALLMYDLLDAPAGFYRHIMRTTCSVSNILAWGHRGRKYEDFWGHACVPIRDANDDLLTESSLNARRKSGIKRDCLADRLLDGDKGAQVELSFDEQNHFLGLVVEGGAETTANSILTTILCLALNPHVQKNAQQELDNVCGAGRYVSRVIDIRLES